MLTPAVIAAACALMAGGALPDHQCIPGSVQSTSTATICTPGWASHHRHVTAATRALVYRRYGLGGPHPFPDWEIDHRVPLELGGSNAITNLWPEHHPQTKDRLETRLSRLVCRKQISLRFAQRLIATNWLRARHWVNEHFPKG